MTEPTPLQQIDRTYVRFENRKLSYFAGCDYFRLASHPRVLQATAQGIKKYGLNVAASRMTTGNHQLFGALEEWLGRYFGASSATLVANGYVTNLVVAQALAGEFSDVLIDEKAHPSLKDAAKMFQAKAHPFGHRDPNDLKRVLRACSKRSKIIVLTDGMFSHNGAIAPLAAYLSVMPKSAWLLVDDAHGAGTLGKTGRGAVELAQINRDSLIQTITLSKAFGVYGGAILGNKSLREKILSRSGMFVGSTPFPLPMANAAITSVQILRQDKSLRARLRANVTLVKNALQNVGLPMNDGPSPIIPIIPNSSAQAEELRARCLKNNVFPSFIKYPGGPENGYFRFVLSSEHKKAQLHALLESLLGQ